jgi:hypothetical protein
MRRRLWAAGLGLLAMMVQAVGVQAGPPLPEPRALAPVAGDACTPDNPYQAHLWQRLEPYGDRCRRLHFSVGPLHVKAGQMDATLQPVTVEKPAYPGYVVRFKPGLVNADGSVPDIAQVHLHHAAWLQPSAYRYPFFAAGEEKTIIDLPAGYGMHVGAGDVWLLLHMIHNQTPEPRVVFLTYDVDYVADADAAALGIVPVRPVWLDVQHRPVAPGAPDRFAYPVFNVQRGFGHVDPALGRRVCTWPRENCARFDSFGYVTPQQGAPVLVPGADREVTADIAGTLIAMGGHLHPGGVRDEVSLVRGGVERPIYVSDAVPWSRTRPDQAGGPRNSWDFAMAVTNAALGWKVRIRTGDLLRLNATYDTEAASWYENMGIVVAWVAPDDPHGDPGVDVFSDPVTLDPGVPVTALAPAGSVPPSCAPRLAGAGRRLCLRGEVTHAHLAEASNFGGCQPGACGPIRGRPGPLVSDLVAAGFNYGAADILAVGAAGIPRLRLGQPARFWNTDSAVDIWHTFTLCTEAAGVGCTGSTGIAYPLAGGGRGTPDDVMDFDSTELGFGMSSSPARGQIPGAGFPDQTVQQATSYSFTPTRTGTFQFFCRVHPAMRGVFAVVP